MSQQFALQEMTWAFVKNKTVSKQIMDIYIQPRQEMVKSHFRDPLDAKSVNVPHGEVLDAQVLQYVTEMTRDCFLASVWTSKVQLKPSVLWGGYKQKVFYCLGRFWQGVVNYSVI